MENSISSNSSGLIFVIGAARSGTKIVRDVLSTHPDINCVPYDINFIWRTGNERLPDDRLTPDNYKDRYHQRIDRYLRKYQGKAPYLIEKTVSNTIRIPFLLKHYPDAKFIFLYRNGMDVCESVLRQWKAPNDKRYLLKKMKHVPVKELINYGVKFAARNIVRKKDHFYWGVQYPGLRNELKEDPSLEAIVANQWKYCVGQMLSDRDMIGRHALLEIRYEEFVLNPHETMKSMIKFIDEKLDVDNVRLQNIKKGNIGKSVHLLTDSQKQSIVGIIGQTMTQLNYTL